MAQPAPLLVPSIAVDNSHRDSQIPARSHYHEEPLVMADPSFAEKSNIAIQETTERLKAVVTESPVVVNTAEILQKHFSPDSHELAAEQPVLKGVVQTDSGLDGNKVRDVGWHRPTVELQDPLIGGIPNGELFSKIRRFNKDVFHVKEVPLQFARGLDLNEAWSDEHANDKMTLHLQRLYLNIVLGVVSFAKQISRLRSWKERQRTLAFCVTYFVAWLFDLLVPLALGSLIAIVSSHRARQVLFPSAPLALVDITTGGLQTPASGHLGTINTLTGAPEKEEGEAVEEEAANFVDNLRHVIARAIGMHEKEEKEGDPLESKIPKPVRNAAKAVKAAGAAPGHTSEDSEMTQKPMEEIIWSKVKPEKIEKLMKVAPHVIGEIVDNWERFTNALVPMPPFSPYSYLRLDAILIPLFLLSLFVNYYMVYKGIGFLIGFGLFGNPVLSPGLTWFNRNCPQWLELLEPKNNFLRGIPTNSQLTLTLLRIGEANYAPLPPVPTSKPEDGDQLVSIDSEEIPLTAPNVDIEDAIQPSVIAQSKSADATSGETKHKKLSKIIRLLKGNTKAVVSTKMVADHVRAKLGSEHAKDHLGILPKKKNLIYAGPSEYKARFDGKKGWVYIDEEMGKVIFATSDPKEKLETVLEIKLEDMQELKRATAFVSKPAEMAAGWSSENYLLGSVEIVDRQGKTLRFTALPERDELFNRLVAISSHRWVNM